MPNQAGKSAAGKGGAKSGYVMPGSKTSTISGGHPPKTTCGIVKSAKSGK